MRKSVLKSIAAIVICLAMVFDAQVLTAMAGEVNDPEVTVSVEADEAEGDPAGEELPEEEELLEEVKIESEPYDGTYTPPGVDYVLKYEVLDNDTIKITGIAEGGTASGELVIPDEIEGKAVTEIGDMAFAYYKNLTGNLTIPDSVTTIGRRAFYDCTGFDGSLTIGKNVTTIGEGAFGFENYLSGNYIGNLIIPDGVTTIGKDAFKNCGKFTGNLVIPDSVATIGEYAFCSCRNLTGSLTIPTGVTRIESNTFAGCGFTGNLTIPDGVTFIGTGAFGGCGFTGSLIIPDSVTYIGNSAFEQCYGFTGNLTIPDSVTYIGEAAFHECTGFDGDLTIGNSVTQIEMNTFNHCTGFRGCLTIGKSVTRILDYAFSSCDGFRKVVNRSNFDFPLKGPAGTTWIKADTGNLVSSLKNGTAIRSDFYDPVDARLFTHDAVDAQTYTGKAIKPAVKVYFGETELVEKKDYTIAYANNTNAGMASFTVTGKGNYAEKDSDCFEILKKKLTDADVIITEPAAAKYTKKEQTPVPKITYNGMTLKKDKDFTVSYYADRYCSDWCIPKEPGEYYLKITGIGNYEGEKKIPFVIASPKKKLMSTLKADKIADKAYAGGGKIKLADNELVIHDGGKILEKGTDYYELTDSDYAGNKYPGTAKVTVRGKNGYAGTLTVTFKIKGTPISQATITVAADTIYDGSEQKPVPQVTYGGNPLSEGNDYELVYEKNVNAGKAKVTIKGKGGYTGSVSKTFTIRPAMITECTFDYEPTCPYTGSGVKPEVTVKMGGKTLDPKTDYTVKYTNNTALNEGTGTKKPTITITGKGNYSEKTELNFKITQANINTCKVTVDDVIYKDKNGNWKTKKISVTGTDGKALKKTDYEITGYKYKGGSKDGQPVGQEDKVGAGTEIEVTVSGKGNYTGTATGTYRIFAQDISKLTASLDPMAYTGKAVKLGRGDIRWKSGGKPVDDVTFDFDESSYKNNVNKGKATVVVRGTGNYGGTKTITFTIGSKGILWWWRNLFD
ncbi:MAG: leucine-rich repeat domain-containing protein [Lachnospiraceae bacterium]|nr:leucine-rich repeat domain-containing protein [Lachnospiraceae bacterium]